MKSMGNIYHRQQAYLRTKAGQQMMKKEADNIIRRNFAMVFKVLHDNYGFGAKRLVELICAARKEYHSPSADKDKVIALLMEAVERMGGLKGGDLQ